MPPLTDTRRDVSLHLQSLENTHHPYYTLFVPPKNVLPLAVNIYKGSLSSWLIILHLLHPQSSKVSSLLHSFLQFYKILLSDSQIYIPHYQVIDFMIPNNVIIV
ncbi:hypothetical protein L1987_43016 [Smallanthus sonchifolius]|uniref:Uncharacterized protein n=1 Tax=Smallanthus sonchifolius TaxID=185202 RepID=A0ACB9GLG2_9ASTR|nr:hypothetical protein L1987_43016 [Smallanthus sonchifolius]